jgi:hypothetical protein
MLDARLADLRELFVTLDLGPVRAKKVEAAGVDDEVDVGVSDLEQRPLSRPFGPALTPKRVLPAPRTRLRPQTTLWPPAAGPPENSTATRLPCTPALLAPAEVRTTLPEAATVCGNCARTPSLSLVLRTRPVLLKLTGCGLLDEPNAAQTGRGFWRTADSKMRFVCFSVD